MRNQEPSPEDRERLMLILALTAAIVVVLGFGLLRMFRSKSSWLAAAESTYTLDGRPVPMPEEWRPGRSYDVELQGIDGGAIDRGSRTALYVEFPGLHEDQLFDGTDVAATTDYRRVLAEILTKRLGTNDLSQVFPGYSGYSPMGLIQGPPASIFSDDFESGGLGAWSG